MVEAGEPYKLRITGDYPAKTTVFRCEFLEADGACLVAVHADVVRTLFIFEEFAYELPLFRSRALRLVAPTLRVVLILEDEVPKELGDEVDEADEGEDDELEDAVGDHERDEHLQFV